MPQKRHLSIQAQEDAAQTHFKAGQQQKNLGQNNDADQPQLAKKATQGSFRRWNTFTWTVSRCLSENMETCFHWDMFCWMHTKSNHFYCHITTAQVPWWVKFLRACSRQCQKKNIYIFFFYIWAVNIYTYIYSVHIVYYKDIVTNTQYVFIVDILV